MTIDVKKLKLAMARACLDVKELGAAADIGNATLTRILHGNESVRFSTAGKLARALGVDVAEIIMEEG